MEACELLKVNCVHVSATDKARIFPVKLSGPLPVKLLPLFNATFI